MSLLTLDWLPESRASRQPATPGSARYERMVLPEADAERHQQHRRADDQPRAQLVEVIDDAQPLFLAYRPELHRPDSAAAAELRVGVLRGGASVACSRAVPGEPRCCESSDFSSDSELCAIPPLNSLMLSPIDRLSAGRRLGPKNRRTIDQDDQTVLPGACEHADFPSRLLVTQG